MQRNPLLVAREQQSRNVMLPVYNQLRQDRQNGVPYIFHTFDSTSPKAEVTLDCIFYLLGRFIRDLRRGRTRTLRSYYYIQLVRIFPDHNITPQLVSKCVNHIANHFNFKRDELPVTIRQSRGFYCSPEVEIIIDDTPLDIIRNDWNPIPQDPDMLPWDNVEIYTNAQLLLGVESNAISEDIIQAGILTNPRRKKKLVPIIIVEYGGFASEACTSFLTKLSQATRIDNEFNIVDDPDDEGVPCRSFCYSDLWGCAIGLIENAGTVGPYAIQNQDGHIVVNLVPILVQDIDTHPFRVPMTDLEVERRPLKWLWKTLAHLYLAGDPYDTGLMWCEAIEQIERSNCTLPHSAIDNLTEFLLSHEEMQELVV